MPSFGKRYVKSGGRYFAYEGMSDEVCTALTAELTGMTAEIISDAEYMTANPPIVEE